jgi:hypothetical protein
VVDILTCDVERGYVIAFAYETRSDGEHFKIMQAYAVDVSKALKALHDMSCKRLAEYFADCNHELRPEHLANCHIGVSVKIQSPSEFKDPDLSDDGEVSIDMPVSAEEPETLKAKPGSTVVQEGMEKALPKFERNKVS